ncbi:DUF2497 domain-containing protein [Rickettsiales endosymbiont of Peranema trichophorum]|uniref:DUF2497 domain-containing protein n=1 Tax=Rickettsiales endosymbiont of Peranema trichophorum TaxID=2486577 RepID=UPI001023F11A|nr:DUF2497 domain-containing protein [Rickettsiales endosymbiont of Peranema trichophorum]RZI47707.1 DUF2497 domain-containing protein [Rickettsiales endosymbiont of Peranema trichophorum]
MQGKSEVAKEIDNILNDIKETITSPQSKLNTNILELTDVVKSGEQIGDDKRSTLSSEQQPTLKHEATSDVVTEIRQMLKALTESTLHSTKPLDHSKTLEEVIVEMLHPKLDKWLDTNLQKIVEDVIERKIERLYEAK